MLKVLVSYCYSNLGREKTTKKRLSEQNVFSRTENILDPIVRELEKVAKTEGIKSYNVELVLLIYSNNFNILSQTSVTSSVLSPKFILF